jgi:hypothetical protein
MNLPEDAAEKAAQAVAPLLESLHSIAGNIPFDLDPATVVPDSLLTGEECE